MSSLLDRFVSRTDFESYEDFKENFKRKNPDEKYIKEAIETWINGLKK